MQFKITETLNKKRNSFSYILVHNNLALFAAILSINIKQVLLISSLVQTKYGENSILRRIKSIIKAVRRTVGTVKMTRMTIVR